MQVTHPRVMAESSESSCLQRLLSDLDTLDAEMEKISSLKRFFRFTRKGQKSSLKYVVLKVRKQIESLHGLLKKIGFGCQENIEQELQDTVETEQNEAQHLQEAFPNGFSAPGGCESVESQRCDVRQRVNEAKRKKVAAVPGFPSDMPATSTDDSREIPAESVESQRCDVRQRVNETKRKKAAKSPVSILPVTPEDLGEIPMYMKCRITCDQINAVVENLNKAITSKYRIRNQAPSSMSAADRNTYYRYLREERSNKEGCVFIVEEDIQLFTPMKTDKRFHKIIVILRHCRRLKEIHVSGITRYVIC
ncbi:spindle and kinetochore-associated protein 1-like isoform X2 [Melopsittacus undulatus]|uniref:spindle and kinetochore-associated protein 1-like isoform X2 n=1 Tax=Melopsittacus undulatus TaxID=13146 RepID=UPI00146CA306|nr:spindle and kinetochore-associated protein 1-like isoform X2 [Melopsittacus undulatus]